MDVVKIDDNTYKIVCEKKHSLKEVDIIIEKKDILINVINILKPLDIYTHKQFFCFCGTMDEPNENTLIITPSISLSHLIKSDSCILPINYVHITTELNNTYTILVSITDTIPYLIERIIYNCLSRYVS